MAAKFKDLAKFVSFAEIFFYYFSSNTYILLDVLLCSIAEYFYELCRILASP